MRILGVIPNDRLDDYEAKGIGPWLERYYNPQGYFDRVYCLSPLEGRRGERFGMLVLPTRPGQIPRRVRELHVDVLRGYGGFHPANVLAAAGDTRIPLVLSIHDSSSAMLSDNVRVADLVWCTSRVVADLVRHRGVLEANIRILPNRVDRARFCPDPSDPGVAALRTQHPWRYGILHVGRRSHEKNLDTVIAALALLGSEYGLLAIGPGDAGPYRAQAEVLDVGDRCRFLAPVPNETLPSYYRWCACLCGPSRWEGFGLVLIEAMACGAVVVTSAIPPMTEYIQGGINGILVEAFEDPKTLASAIVRACEGSGLDAMREAARETTRPFAVETVAALEVALYREALAVRRGRPGPAGAPSWWGKLRRALPW